MSSLLDVVPKVNLTGGLQKFKLKGLFVKHFLYRNEAAYYVHSHDKYFHFSF